jgi:serine protease inhibitor
MILISGLFFQGNWANVFNKTFTKREAFHDTHMNKVGDVNMMFQRGPFAYSAVKDLGCHIIELPYAEAPANRNDGNFGTGLSMILVLPRKGLEMGDAINNVYQYGMENIYRELRNAKAEYEDDEVEVHVPRFEISTSLNMKETLEQVSL